MKLSVLTAAAFALLTTCSFAAAERPPNIVLILADDLGYGDLGCYGQRLIKTPNIDRLAADGMRFTQFYAGSTVCAPSRCVLMTGLHSGHCLIRGNAKTNLRPSDVTVAEVLKAKGYTTGLFGKWGLGHEHSDGVPTRQGFDEFLGYLDQHHAHNYFPAYLMRGESRLPLKNVVPGDGEFGTGVASQKVEYSPDLIGNAALDFIDRQHDQPFFLYFASTLPHANNEAGKQGMEIPELGQYANENWMPSEKGKAAMIGRLDFQVGQIMDRLKKHGIDDETVVFFSSDNGPHGEGGVDPKFFDSNGPLRGTKRDLFEGGIRVPFIARWPGKIAAGAENDHVGSFADFLPTAADLAAADLSTATDGLSIVPTLFGKSSQQEHRYLYWEFYERGSAQAVRAGNWKGVVQPMNGTELQLFDLSQDIGEEHDVAKEHPDVVKQLLGFIDEAHVPSPLWQVRGQPKANR